MVRSKVLVKFDSEPNLRYYRGQAFFIKRVLSLSTLSLSHSIYSLSHFSPWTATSCYSLSFISRNMRPSLSFSFFVFLLVFNCGLGKEGTQERGMVERGFHIVGEWTGEVGATCLNSTIYHKWLGLVLP